MVYKFCFFVPDSHLDQVKDAVFATGAGKIGCYDRCAWQVKGTGQFRPLAGNNAYVGVTDQLQCIEEYKVEMICRAEYLSQAIEALKGAHPYETPAYEYWQVGGSC